jgi:hypothetical protein
MGLSASGLAALRTYIVARDVNSQTVVDYQAKAACSEQDREPVSRLAQR